MFCNGTMTHEDDERTALMHSHADVEQHDYGARDPCEPNDSSGDGAVEFAVERHQRNYLLSCVFAAVDCIKKEVWAAPYFIGMFCFSALFAVPFTFFPAVASSKGLQAWEFGIAYSTRKAAGMLAPFTSQILVAYSSPKWGVVVSQAAFGVQGVVFGASCLLQSKDIFLGVSILGFIILEISLGIINICTETILASTLKERGNLLLGSARSFSEIGMIFGAFAGGALVDVSDYSAPFYVFAGALLAVTPLVIVSQHETTGNYDQDAPNDGDRSPDINERAPVRRSLWPLLLNPFFAADLFARALCWAVGLFNSSTLEPYIAQMHESSACIGAAFSVNFFASTVGYAVTCSSYSRKYENLWIFTGLTTMALAYLIIGPAPFIPIEPSFALICTAQAMRGFGAGIVVVCSYSHAMRIAVDDNHYPDNERTRGFVSAAFSFVSSSLTIPLSPLAGLLVSKYGYRHASMLMFGLLGFSALISGWIWLRCESCCRRKRNAPSRRDELQEDGTHDHCTYPPIESSPPVVV